MPRVENSGPEVDAWYAEHNGAKGGSSTHDVCLNCSLGLLLDRSAHNDKLTPFQDDEPQGSDGWVEMDAESHPAYDDCEYNCAICDVQLTGEDD